MRWRLYIEEYSPDLQYIKGTHNVVADTPSHLDINETPFQDTQESFLGLMECFANSLACHLNWPRVCSLELSMSISWVPHPVQTWETTHCVHWTSFAWGAIFSIQRGWRTLGHTCSLILKKQKIQVCQWIPQCGYAGIATDDHFCENAKREGDWQQSDASFTMESRNTLPRKNNLECSWEAIPNIKMLVILLYIKGTKDKEYTKTTKAIVKQKIVKHDDAIRRGMWLFPLIFCFHFRKWQNGRLH